MRARAPQVLAYACCAVAASEAGGEGEAGAADQTGGSSGVLVGLQARIGRLQSELQELQARVDCERAE